ncbi:FAD-binding oxidoreductase [Streptomyces sp. NBRC 109706]|uniref:FAD-binding oxidoreductase n=1 Tax=Streptomyces sp. NBRC 109706 TaxID=1550035 RepID=UPI00099CE0E7|nr:FAD-binding oxidoreductase [Streptomyces sp. NBRC 109706]
MPAHPLAKQLARHLRGAVFDPGDASSAASEPAAPPAPFNGIARHHPALTVAAEDRDDVRTAVAHAAEQGLPVAVRATGHGITRPADGGLLISTHRMNEVRVDPATRTARAAAGARWEQVIRAAWAYGLAPLNGSSPLVGVVGYTLGGGLGPLARRYGYAADLVTRLEVITADARVRQVSAGDEADLYWGLRGSKDNLGIVTELEFGLVPVDRFYGGGLYFPGWAAAEVSHTWRMWTATVPETMTSSLALVRLPDWPQLPEPLRGAHTVHLRVAHTGPVAEGEALIAPLRAVTRPLYDTVTERPYLEIARVHDDPVEPLDHHAHSVMLRDLDAAAVDQVLTLVGPEVSQCPAYMVELRHLGGAAGRPPAVPSAVGNRDAAFSLMVISPPGSTSAYADALLKRMVPWSTGRSYVNFLTGPLAISSAPEVHDPCDLVRLAELKRTHDPDNMFRFNHNIAPARGRGA